MVTARGFRRGLGHPRSTWVGLALPALLLAAGWAFSNRGDRRAPQDHRELYLERGRQLLLAGDWQRSLVYLGEAYSGAEADAGVRFLVARAAAPLRGRPPGGGLGHQQTPRFQRRWSSADLNHDWTRIVALDAGGEAAIFDPDSGRRLVGLAGVAPGLAAVRFSPDGEHVTGVHAGGRFSLWRVDTGELVLSRDPPPGRIPETGGGNGAGPAMAFCAGGRRLITATSAGAVRLW